MTMMYSVSVSKLIRRWSKKWKITELYWIILNYTEWYWPTFEVCLHQNKLKESEWRKLHLNAANWILIELFGLFQCCFNACSNTLLVDNICHYTLVSSPSLLQMLIMVKCLAYCSHFLVSMTPPHTASYCLWCVPHVSNVVFTQHSGDNDKILEYVRIH